MKNLYKILEIKENASQDKIKKAYRTLAKKYHPDSNLNDESTAAKFREITEAYEILRNEKLRKEYDHKLFNAKTTHRRTNQSTRAGMGKEQSQNPKKTNKMNVDLEFERFFGFNPKTKESRKNTVNNKKNPIDTTNIFDAFFKVKRD